MSFWENIFNPVKALKALKLATAEKNTRLSAVVVDLLDGKTLEVRQAASDAIKENPHLLNSLITDDGQDALRKKDLLKVGSDKKFKEIFFNFFGMNENWSLGRNILGGLMVHCPEWPTYFIPAYTQAKATGDATDLKKGEGPRGLITGGLEGIAVGALVSGRFLKPKEMGPYIILGAALQLFSSTVFPWIGEKMGQYAYNNRLHEEAQNSSKKNDTAPQEQAKPVVFNSVASVSSPKFQGRSQYPKQYSMLSSGSLKI